MKQTMWVRFRNRVLMGAIIVGSLSLTAMGDENKTAENLGAEKTDPVKEAAAPPSLSFSAAVTTIRIQLNEEHRYGLEIKNEDVISLIKDKNGVTGLCRELEKYGKVNVIAQSETPAQVGKDVKLSVGSETPYLTAYYTGSGSGRAAKRTEKMAEFVAAKQKQPIKDKETVREKEGVQPPTDNSGTQDKNPESETDKQGSTGAYSYSQSVVPTGITATLRKVKLNSGYLSFSYDVSLDAATRVNASAGDQNMTLIQKNRMEWEGDCSIPFDNGAFVTRSQGDAGDHPTEFLCIFTVKPLGK